MKGIIVKKVLLVIMTLFVLSINQVCAKGSDLSKYSDDSRVMLALEVLQNIGASDVFTRLDKSKTKIIFYDLSLISFSYAKHYAISSTDDSGNNYILINEKFRLSAKEAVACLIAHESVHVLPQPNLDEEARATTTEAITWLKVRELSNIPLGDDLVAHENKLAILYRASTPTNNLIKDSIAGNSFYQSQLAMK